MTIDLSSVVLILNARISRYFTLLAMSFRNARISRLPELISWRGRPVLFRPVFS